MNDPDQRPTGQLFSRIYLDRPANVKDSVPLRRRVSALFQSLGLREQRELADYIQMEIGAVVPRFPGYEYTVYKFPEFLEQSEVAVFLNSLTLIFRFLTSARSPRTNHWRNEVERFFRAELAVYEMDELGGVHLRVDSAFQAARSYAVEALRGPRYATAADLLSRSYELLNGNAPNLRDSFKNAFDAVETVFKLLTGQPRIGAQEARQHLTPITDVRYTADATAKLAAQKTIRALGEWVDASHPYRHGPSGAGQAEPPEEIWQLLMSQAAAYARWLAELDRAVNPSG